MTRSCPGGPGNLRGDANVYGVTERFFYYSDDDCCGPDNMLLILFLFINIYYFILFYVMSYHVWLYQICSVPSSCLGRFQGRASDRDLPIGKCHRLGRTPLDTAIVDADRGTGTSTIQRHR